MRRLVRSWHARVAVVGHSMEPTLRDGDWLLVDPDAYTTLPARAGDLVVANDPRRPQRWLIKRVADVAPDGSLTLVGDHPAHSAEPGLDGIRAAQVVGRPWCRYWPPRRAGRIG